MRTEEGFEKLGYSLDGLGNEGLLLAAPNSRLLLPKELSLRIFKGTVPMLDFSVLKGSSLDCSKEIKPVHPKGNQPCIFIRRTDAEAPVLWLPDAKRLTGKDRDAGED